MLGSIFITIMIFYLLYYPPLFGGHALRIIAIISWIYILVNNGYINRKINKSKLLNVYTITVVIATWVAIQIVLRRTSFGEMNGILYMLITTIPASLVIGTAIRKKNGDIYTLINHIFVASMVQSIISILMFVSPVIKRFFLGILQEAEVLDVGIYGYYVRVRLFGFTSGLTYAMPVVQAFIGMIALYFAINKNIKYIGIVPFLIFSAVINARTSLVIIIICGILILTVGKKLDIKHIGKLFLIISAAMLFLWLGVKIIRNMSADTFSWVQSGLHQIVGLLKGNYETGYFIYIFDSSRWILPGGLTTIIGAGMRVMGSNSIRNTTDIGFINDIWLGGIVYCAMVYSYIVSINRKIMTCKKVDNIATENFLHFLGTSFLLCLVALNFKGYIINTNCFFNLFVLISCYIFIFNDSVKFETGRRSVRFIINR